MSLRSRLVAGFIAVAIALVAADVGVALLVRHSMISATDRRLMIGPRTARPEVPAAGSTPAAGTFPRSNLSDLYVITYDQNGTVRTTSAPGVGRNVQPPKLPRDILSHATPAGVQAKPFSIPAVGGGYGYRAVALKTRQGNVLVLAVSLKETIDTFWKVVLVEGIASFVVLLILSLVAWWLLRLGVRPLDRMAQTADAIAAGDLSRRVDRAEPVTEVGRLGMALNTMLAEIEEAFAERRISEDRLRRFVADASHELRTPLTSIRGYAELWRQGGLDSQEQLSDAMRRMEQEAARMGVLVDDLLLLARLDQGRPLDNHAVDLAALIADAIADAQAVEPSRPISLDAPQHLTVKGDEGRLRQVVANLMANERLHTPPHTEVRVRLHVDGGIAVLEVEDDGPGFGSEPQRVFERFYRADPARARASGGTGLGLSIVAAVVEAHGGRARAGQSASGGASIRVELPVGTETSAVPPRQPEFGQPEFA